MLNSKSPHQKSKGYTWASLERISAASMLYLSSTITLSESIGLSWKENPNLHKIMVKDETEKHSDRGIYNK